MHNMPLCIVGETCMNYSSSPSVSLSSVHSSMVSADKTVINSFRIACGVSCELADIKK